MSDESKNILADLLLRWEERWEHGEDVSASELCKDHPHLVEQLQAKIEVLRRMSWMTQDSDFKYDDPDDLIGKTLGNRYKIESQIAAGGFGRVFKAFDPELERHVAVKVPSGMPHSNGQVDALVEEARRVAKLRHPGIVAVHDVGKDDDLCFIVSDLITGRSLANVITNERPSVKQSVALIARLAENLQIAHNEGIIHRDIKPANVLIDESGNPLLTDFGIATTLGAESLQASPTSGTLPYMSPEQVASEPQLIDARSDVYSLGVVLYELLSGRSPYHARTPGKLREQILFRPPSKFENNVSESVSTVCLKALSKHPADRYSSASELALALRKSLTEKSTAFPWRAMIAVALLTMTGLAYFIGKHVGQRNAPTETSVVEVDAFVFDGNSRIATSLERFGPVTLELWIRPDRYKSDGCHFVVGSDIPGDYGIGLGMCPTNLSVEYVAGDVSISDQPIPIRSWSHVAAVFGESETRLYFNGKHVHTAPVTEQTGGTNFVIGNVGMDNHLAFYMGKIRSVRISAGERYSEDFDPSERLEPDAETVLLYQADSQDGDRVLDLSGNENHGTWQTFTP